MTTIPATDAKNKFGELLEVIHHEPVEISKKGRTVAVVLSIADYQKMQEKITQSELKTDFSWLKKWRDKVKKIPTAKTADEADYYQHLDEKYGS
jgi:prevent-host-death family protein